MQRLYAMMLAGLLCATASMASADSISLNSFKPQVLPVLVQVNSAGKVTDASPSVELSVPVMRLLRRNLDELIRGPAIAKGRPVASQFIMNLRLLSSLREDGKYDAQFAYVSTSPVPAGSWYWVHQDGDRLALANRDSYRSSQRFHFQDRSPDYPWRRATPSPRPPVQNTFHETRDSIPAPSNPGK